MAKRSASWGLVFFGPIVVVGGLIIALRAPVPWVDYWDILAAAANTNGGLVAHLKTAWLPVVDQRMPVVRLWIDVLANITGNRHYGIELALDFGLQFLALVLLIRMVRRLDTVPPRWKTFLTVVMPWLLFWPYAMIRFHNPWYATQYALSITPVIAALAVLQSRWGQTRGLALAVPLVLLAGGAHGTGLLAVPALVAAIVFLPGWRWRHRIVTVVVAAAFVVIMRVGVPVAPGIDPEVVRIDGVGGFLQAMGSCFVPGMHSALPGWFLVVVLSLATWVLSYSLWNPSTQAERRERQAAALFPWLVLAVWGGGVAAATAWARGALTIGTVRYVPLFLFWYAAVLVLAVTAVWLLPENVRARFAPAARWVAPMVIVVCGAAYVYAGARGIENAVEWKHRLAADVARLRFWPWLEVSDTLALFPVEDRRFQKYVLPAVVKRWGLPVPVGRGRYQNLGQRICTVRPESGGGYRLDGTKLKSGQMLAIDAQALPPCKGYRWRTRTGATFERPWPSTPWRGHWLLIFPALSGSVGEPILDVQLFGADLPTNEMRVEVWEPQVQPVSP